MSKNILKNGNEGCLDSSARRIINQNFMDVSLCTTQLDATSGSTGTTLTNVVSLVTDTLIKGRTYKFKINLAGIATSNSGIKVGLKQSVASMLTSIESTARGFTAAAVATQHSTSVTDQASLFASTTAVINTVIEGTFVVALAGTLQVQIAQNALHADTTSVYVGSFFEIMEVAGF